MKAFLMYPDRDFDLKRELPPNEGALAQDLELDTLFGAMALRDDFLLKMARRAVLSSLTDPAEIVYRQHVLADCLEQPSIVREIYALSIEAIESPRSIYFGWLRDSPESILNRSVGVLELLVGSLRRLRKIVDAHAAEFRSEGFARLFAMLEKELDDEYFRLIEGHLKTLRFRSGSLVSVALGDGAKGVDHVLRRPHEQSWLQRFSFRNRPSYSFAIADRDENGFKALSELRGRGVNLVANALAQSTDHILSFFTMLRTELAFYVGSLNLHARLVEKGEPVCFPLPEAKAASAFSARGLYDACLSLKLETRAVGNDVNADSRSLVIITGANQGGKSTFLRSVGITQLMMQCGMFVPAASLRASVCSGLFTHFKREEDSAMKSGKLDEELRRMSGIVDAIVPDSILLCNESFASTNEREGSEIARQIVRGMLEAGVRVHFVTHLFDLAQGCYLHRSNKTLFLRAEREENGTRSFKLVEGEPLPTSYGEDLYRRIFGTAQAVQMRASLFQEANE